MFIHVQFFFSSPVESLCHTCTRGKPKCSEFHVQFFFLAHLLRAYAIHVPVANLNVHSSMFNFFFSSSVESLCHTCSRGVVSRLMQTFEPFFFSSSVESLCHTCTPGKPKCSEFHVQFFFSSSVESLCHTCTRGVVSCLMQTFENLLLQNCATKFLYITYK